MQSVPNSFLTRTPSISSATTEQTASEWGGSQATLAAGATRQNNNASGHIYIRFIDPENALGQKLSSVPVFSDPIALSTKISDLKALVKTKFFSKPVNTPFVVDLHLQTHPLLSDGNLTLFDYDLFGTKKQPLNLFVNLRYNGVVGTTRHFGDDLRSTSNCSAWHPIEGTSRAGISAFCSSLEMLKRKVTDRTTQRAFLTALWQTTHYLPAVYAMSSLFDSKTLTPEEKAALAQTFQSLAIRTVPDWATGGKPENALEGSRQLLGWLLDQVIAQKRGGSGREDWSRKVIIKSVTGASQRREGDPVTPENNIVSMKLQSGEEVKVTLEFLDKSAQTYPDSRQLALAFKGKYAFDGDSYLVFPKDAGSLLEHRILHRPTQDGFYEQIINTTNLPALGTVAPLSLSSSKPPVLTLNNEGLVSIFEFGGECATEWARLWNPVTGVQLIMHNDQGQALAKTLKDVIQSRKVSGAWPLDGWDVGCLNASSIDTRKPKEAVMICLDCSSSMFDPAYPNEDVNLKSNEKISRMTAAKMLFKNYATTASNYKLPVWFGVMKFDVTVTTMQEFTPLLGDIEPAIEKLRPAGMTAMWDCIYEAAEQLIDFEEKNQGTKLRIVVLTDGIDNRSKQTDKTVYSLLWDHNIILDSVVIGSEYFRSLFKICKVTGGYAMKPQSTQEIIQIAEMETMVDQSQRPPVVRDAYLPFFDSVIPMQPFTVNAFSVPESRNHPNQDDEFMSLANAHKVFGKNKQFQVSKGEVRAASDVVKSRRMMFEIKDMVENPHPDMDIYISESNMSFWKIVMQGPGGSNYESGTFVMFLDMTDDFPRRAPQARFITPIIHPNVNKHGRVCHAIIDQDWKAETKVRDILCCIYGLLMAPEQNEPVDAVATLKYWTDENLYSSEIASHIKKFASTDRKDWAHRIVPDLDAIPGAEATRTTTAVRRVTIADTIAPSNSIVTSRANAYDPSALRKTPVKATPAVPPASTTSATPSETTKSNLELLQELPLVPVTKTPATTASTANSTTSTPILTPAATPPVPASPALSASSSVRTSESVALPPTSRFAAVKTARATSTPTPMTQQSPSMGGTNSLFFGNIPTVTSRQSVIAPALNTGSSITATTPTTSESETSVAAKTPSIHSAASSRSSLSMQLKKVFGKRRS